MHRTIPVCFTKEQLERLEGYGKRRGMLNASQALESLVEKA